MKIRLSKGFLYNFQNITSRLSDKSFSDTYSRKHYEFLTLKICSFFSDLFWFTSSINVNVKKHIILVDVELNCEFNWDPEEQIQVMGSLTISD